MNEPSTAQSFRKYWGFVVGFAGWYLVNGIIWSVPALNGSYSANSYNDPMLFLTCGMFTFAVNSIVLLIAFIKWRQVALGIIAALAINFVASLILQALVLGTCGIPFFTDLLYPDMF